MEQNQYDLLEVLQSIDPAELSYQDWVNVGMALKYEGYDVGIWEDWSRRDPGRFHTGECLRKWRSFSGSSAPVKGGTLVQMARDQGWTPPADLGIPLGWDDAIASEGVVVDSNWIEGKEVEEPGRWDPVKDLTLYLETLFDSTENVGYVTQSFEKDGKYMPTRVTGTGRLASSLRNWPAVAGTLAGC